MNSTARSFLAGVLPFACLFGVPTVQAVTLTSNLINPADGLEDITTTRWLASKFSTDDNIYLLNKVTLRLQQNTGGAFVAAIYSDAGGKPGKLVGLLTAEGTIVGTLADVQFKSDSNAESLVSGGGSSGGINIDALNLPKGSKVPNFEGSSTQVSTGAAAGKISGIALEPGTTYWVVSKADSGEFASGYTDSELGTGQGFSSTWAHSEDGGTTWTTETLSPLFVDAAGDIYAPVDPTEFRIDRAAIASAMFSAMPVALLQRDLAFALAQGSTRDVNARLFRLRSGLNGKIEQGDAENRRWEFFATGQYGSNDTDTFQSSAGFQSDITTETVGVEFKLSSHFTVGAAVSLAQSDNSLGMGLGDVDIDGLALTGYLSYTYKNFYADVLYSYGSNEHDISRDTLFGETARAHPDSQTNSIQVNLGYNIKVGGFYTGPLASLDYINGDLDAYVETGGGTARVAVRGQNFESLISRIGWQISRTFEVGKFQITPQLRLVWTHEYANESEAVDLSLKNTPFSYGSGDVFTPIGKFDTSSLTASAGEDSFNVGFGLGITCSERITVIVDYEARLLQDQSAGHFVSMTGSINF